MKEINPLKEVKIYSAKDNIQAEMIIETFKNNPIASLKLGLEQHLIGK